MRTEAELMVWEISQQSPDSVGPAESPVTSHAKTLLRGFVLMFRRFTILIKLSSGTNLVKSIVAREK